MFIKMLAFSQHQSQFFFKAWRFIHLICQNAGVFSTPVPFCFFRATTFPRRHFFNITKLFFIYLKIGDFGHLFHQIPCFFSTPKTQNLIFYKIIISNTYQRTLLPSKGPRRNVALRQSYKGSGFRWDLPYLRCSVLRAAFFWGG